MLRLNTTLVGRLQNLDGVMARVNSTAVAASVVPIGWSMAKSFDTIPGPKPLPLIGNAWRFIPGIGDFSNLDNAQVLSKLHDQYGKIVRLGGFPGLQDRVLIYDPDDVETVFRNEGVYPQREGLKAVEYYFAKTRKNRFKRAGGVLASHGSEWGENRSTANQHMLQPRTTQVYVGPIEEVADEFVNKLPALRNRERGEMPDDFINELGKWALESITLIALDTKLGCLQSNFQTNSEAQRMVNSLRMLHECLYKLELTASPWMYISTPTWRKFVGCMDTIVEISTKYVNQMIERSKTLPPDHEPRVLQRMLAQDSDPETAVTMAADFLTTGIDTVACSVSFLLYHLASNPKAQNQLHQEIDRVFPRESKEPITIQNLNDMKYLKACIKESLRMNPIVVGTLRTTSKEMVLQGHRIPKNSSLVMCNMLMSNQEQHFKRPARFIPERWLRDQTDNDLSYKKTHPFVYLPFGYGPRSCIGRRLAEMEMEVLVIKMLRKYKLEWHHPPLEAWSKLINNCKSPLKFKMIDRN